jgi:hypothetical protein
VRGTHLETDRAGGSIPANETTGGQKRRDLPMVIVEPVASSAQPQFEW